MEKALETEVGNTEDSLGLGRGSSMVKSKDAMKASSNGRRLNGRQEYGSPAGKYPPPERVGAEFRAVFPRKFRSGRGTTDTALEVSYNGKVASEWTGPAWPGNQSAANHYPTGAYRFRPDGKRFRLRVVVGRLATLKVDQASIAEARFSLAA